MNLVTTKSKSYPRFRLILARFLLALYLCSLSGSFCLEVFHFIDHNFQVPSFVLQHQRVEQQMDWNQITTGNSGQKDSMVHQIIHFGKQIEIWNSGHRERDNPISTSPTFKIDQHYTGQSLELPNLVASEDTQPFWRPVSSTLNSYVQLLLRPPRLKA